MDNKWHRRDTNIFLLPTSQVVELGWGGGGWGNRVGDSMFNVMKTQTEITLERAAALIFG